MTIRQVGKILEELTAGTGFPVPFTQLLRIPLTQPGRILSGEPPFRWYDLVFACCEASGGSRAAAPRVAAAVELLIAALDVLDDIEDGDSSPLVTVAGTAKALNVSTALIFLSQQAIATLPQDGIAEHRIPKFLDALARHGAFATIGQHLDLCSEGDKEISTLDALEIARQKAGSLVAAACRLGALLGTDDESLLGLYERWGRHWGTMSQLANDFHDAQGNLDKTDLDRRKPTLPIVFGGLASSSEPNGELTVARLRDSGALHFTWVIFEIEREACRKSVTELERRGQSVARLAEMV